MSFISKPEQRNHIRYKTIDVIKFIKPIIFNDYIICKNPSTEKRNIDKIKQKVLINKKIGIPISPFSNYKSLKSRNENNIKKTKSGNISTSDSSNKTKFSRIISFSTTNINPFLIEEESKIINQKNDLNKRNNKTKSIIQTYKAYKIFSLSKNNIIRSTYTKIVVPKKDFVSYVYTTLLNVFKPIDNVSPFVIYCLHSNNSYEIFFGKDNKNVKKNEEDWVIPRNLTQNMLHQSLCIPILYWEWFGYHEWIDIDTFVKEFGDDYEKAENKIKKRKKNKNI
jgi:hypothetical protein